MKRPARKPPVPPKHFMTTGSLKAGAEQIDYGYLPLAHTDGDIYVFFRNCECSRGGRRRLAAARSGARLFHRSVDRRPRGRHGCHPQARNEQTRIVPAYGPVMTESGIQGGARHDGRGSGPRVETGSGRRRSQGHAGGRRSEGPRREPGKIRTSSCMTRPRVCWAHHNKLDPMLFREGQREALHSRRSCCVIDSAARR